MKATAWWPSVFVSIIIGTCWWKTCRTHLSLCLLSIWKLANAHLFDIFLWPCFWHSSLNRLSVKRQFVLFTFVSCAAGDTPTSVFPVYCRPAFPQCTARRPWRAIDEEVYWLLASWLGTRPSGTAMGEPSNMWIIVKSCSTEMRHNAVVGCQPPDGIMMC